LPINLDFLWCREYWNRCPYFRSGRDRFLIVFGTTINLYRILYCEVSTLIIVERMCDLIHNIIGAFEKTQNTVIQLDTHIVSIFLQTKWTEVEIFEPVIVELLCDCSLKYLKLYHIFWLDYFAELDPSRPQIRELIQALNKYFSCLFYSFLLS